MTRLHGFYWVRIASVYTDSEPVVALWIPEERRWDYGEFKHADEICEVLSERLVPPHDYSPEAVE